MLIQLVIVQILTFIGLVLVMRKILISSSYKETSRLQRLNEENAAKSQELAAKLLEAENEYRDKITKAEDEVREMKAKARKEIDDLKEAMIARGKAEGEHIIAEALSSKKEMRAEIEAEMKDRSVELACQIFQKILTSAEQRYVFDGLLASVLKELEDLDENQLKGIEEYSEDGMVEVKASHALNTKQKEQLDSVLSSKLGKKITCRETLDKEVISGIVIMLGSFVIDGSISDRFRKAAEEID